MFKLGYFVNLIIYIYECCVCCVRVACVVRDIDDARPDARSTFYVYIKLSMYSLYKNINTVTVVMTLLYVVSRCVSTIVKKELNLRAPWLILPVVICLSQRLSHACLSASRIKAIPRMAQYISFGSLDLTRLLG